jgi:hypothetical protein
VPGLSAGCKKESLSQALLRLSKVILFDKGIAVCCAHKFHTCSLSGIFFAAHVAEENDLTFFRRCGGERLRGSLVN